MLDRHRFLAPWEGPMTAVAGRSATPRERERALPPLEAFRIVVGLRRDSFPEILIALFELATGAELDPMRGAGPDDVFARLQSATMAGHLLLLKGWEQDAARGPGDPAGEERETTEDERVRRIIRRVTRQVMSRQAELAFEGRVYRLVPAGSASSLARTDGYRVVAVVEARAVVARMSRRLGRGTAEDQADWTEISERLGDGEGGRDGDREGGVAGGLVLLVRVAAEGGSSPAPREPAITPSQLRARMVAAKAANDNDVEPTIRLVNIEAPTFVPGVETNRISYAIDGPVAKTASVVMIVRSMPAKGDPVVVQSLAIDGPYSPSGTVEWDGKASTLTGLITLKGSPYQVTFELTSKSGARSISGAGTIRIEVKETKIVVDDTGMLAVPERWKATVAALVAELRKSGMPGDCAGRVMIESPLFKVETAEMYDRTSAIELERAVGAGPPVPFVAEIKLRSKDGTGKRSAPVLIGTRVLWDFKLESSGELDGSLSARGVQPIEKAFMKKAASYEESATQPAGASAHLAVGGFRARSRDRAAAGAQWTLAGDWPLTSPSERDWAGFTDCGATSLDDRADSGVYFSAGRMAGDTFKVRAVVDVDEGLDVPAPAAPDGAPATCRSNTVKLVNWRRVPIVGNWIVGAGTTPVDIPPLTAEYKKAAMLVEANPGVAVEEVGDIWKAAYRRAIETFASDAFLKNALEPDPQGYPMRYREFFDFWERANRESGYLGVLQERIRHFFNGADEDAYRHKCETHWPDVLERSARHLTIPDNGITALKFGTEGPHNQNPTPERGYWSGEAPAVKDVTTRTKAIFFQFTRGPGTDTFIHEVGHTLFLAHAPGSDPGAIPIQGEQASAHDRHEICLMSYDSSKRYLCGLCLLKLSGWNYTRIANDGTIAP